MELSPQAVSVASFKVVKKGYDPDEVRAYLNRVSTTLEAAQQQATAMEARARAAIAKMQDLSQQTAAAPASAAKVETKQEPAPSNETDTISRTLLLAQRTADTTIAEAQAEAESVTSSAHATAETLLNEARAEADRILGEVKADARRVKDEELAKADGEVQSLLARREFLVADVDHLEQYVAAERERVADAASALQELIDRVPAGLGEMRRPLLSASDESNETNRPEMAQPRDDSGEQDVLFDDEMATDGDGADESSDEPAERVATESDRTPVAGDLLFRPNA